jgi:hypothetical protein
VAKKNGANDEGMLRKIKGLYQLSSIFSKLANDGINYFQEKLQDEVLNKHKDAPSGEVAGGYVRAITGMLRNDATQVTEVNPSSYRISLNTGGASRGYSLKIFEWSAKKFGFNPYQIVRGKYTKHFNKAVVDAIRDWVAQFNSDPDKYQYQNPFNPELYESAITAGDAR